MYTFGLDKKLFMILATTLIISSVIGTLVGLTFGLWTQPPPNGGSPVDPQRVARSVDQPRKQFDGSLYETYSTKDVQSEYRSYRYAAVTTDTNICSQIGTDILGRQIGSSVDAAIASFLCVCVVNAHSCGIGGGHFATIYEKPANDFPSKVMTTVTARERAPAAAYEDMFVNNTGASSAGGLAVAVPGEISGFYQAWLVYGRMPWRDLFNETIRICEEGFTVEADLAGAIKQYENSIRDDPNLAELFVKQDGSLVQEGDLLINAKLGQTMRRIADEPMSFYTGSLAEDIVADLQEYGSIITLDDLANYRSIYKPALQVPLSNGDYVLHNPTAPASGVVMSFIMNILNGYNFTSADISDSDRKTLTYHRIAEAFKFAYAKRSQLGDEDYVNVTELIQNLTSVEYAASIREQIDDVWTHDINYYGPTFDYEPDSGTAHMNVLAPDGSAVALTGTINLFFGAKVRGRRTGIIFNDEMDDFSTPGTENHFGVPASPSNYIAPGKIPMSSMSPTLVEDKEGRIVFLSGASGGTRITTETAFVTINSLWFGQDLLTASDTARIHHQLLPNELDYENWLDVEVMNGLAAKNHSLDSNSAIAVVGSVRNNCPISHKSSKAECIEAVSDGRKGGVPDGF